MSGLREIRSSTLVPTSSEVRNTRLPLQPEHSSIVEEDEDQANDSNFHNDHQTRRFLTPEARRNLNLTDEKFSNRLWATGVAHLYNQPDGNSRSRTYRVHLNGLQRMILHHLQHELAHVVSRIVHDEAASSSTMSKARRLMSEYCKPKFC